MAAAQDPVVAMKQDVLERATPAASAMVCGDIYGVDGVYGQRCAELGCERVLVVDTLETEAWLERRKAHAAALDFAKGDFSDPHFMGTIRERFEISVAFDVLLHQPPLLATLHLIAERTERALCIVQPMLAEQALPNGLVFLPGNTGTDQLRPVPEDPEFKIFSPTEVNHTHWIWAMTPSFLRSALAAEGFEVVHEEQGWELPNPAWRYLAVIAERRDENQGHWTAQRPTPGLFDAWW